MTEFDEKLLDYKVSTDSDFEKSYKETVIKVIECETSQELGEILVNFSDDILKVVKKYI